MPKITIDITIKDIEYMKTEVMGRFAVSREELFVLMIREYTGYLKRKGVDFEVNVEEQTEYD